MRIKYSPQRSDSSLEYTFSGDIVTATLDGKSDVFDFSGLPASREAIIESTLDPCPVLAAERTADGELIVTLLKHHGPNPTHDEAFPAEEVV